VLVAAGAHDAYVPLEQTERLAKVLSAAGADVTLRVRDVGHELVQADFADVAAWLAGLTVD
jgi:predicted esterase